MSQLFANLPVASAPLFADRRAAGQLLAARLRRALATPGQQAEEQPTGSSPAPGGQQPEEQPTGSFPLPHRQQAGGRPMGSSPAPGGQQAGQRPTASPPVPGGGGPLVLALPRGGVPVAREVADTLAAPLDVLVTRKIGYPHQPELGVGAIAEGGDPVYDDEFLRRLGLSRADLGPVVARERAELDRRVRVYRGGRPPPHVAGRTVILVDDGLATGVTARAALRSLRSRSAGRTVLAVPVAAPSSAAAMLREADAVVALALPEAFRAVGEWYGSFGQLTDSDVLELLDRGREAG